MKVCTFKAGIIWIEGCILWWIDMAFWGKMLLLSPGYKISSAQKLEATWFILNTGTYPPDYSRRA